MKDLFNEMMEYEDGTLDTTQVVQLFSQLIKSGMVWQLQGSYGRQANEFIDSGYLDRDGNILDKEV